jgi:hypothetical protein
MYWLGQRGLEASVDEARAVLATAKTHSRTLTEPEVRGALAAAKQKAGKTAVKKKHEKRARA